MTEQTFTTYSASTGTSLGPSTQAEIETARTLYQQNPTTYLSNDFASQDRGGARVFVNGPLDPSLRLLLQLKLDARARKIADALHREREAREAKDRGECFEAFRYAHAAARHDMSLQEAIVHATTWLEAAPTSTQVDAPTGLVEFGNLYRTARAGFERAGIVSLRARRGLIGRDAHDRLEAALGPCPCTECPLKNA